MAMMTSCSMTGTSEGGRGKPQWPGWRSWPAMLSRMVVSDWTMQALADIIGAPVDRPEITETTALGAAWLAGMAAGVYPGQEDFARTWALERRFAPRLDAGTRDARYARWKQAVAATLSVV